MMWPRSPDPPTPTTRMWVRYVIGFSVGISVGLAPYLGIVEVPGFAPLLSLYPESMRDTLIAFSAALLGIVAVGVQWYANYKLESGRVDVLFRRTTIATVVAFIFLVLVVTFAVERIPIGSGTQAVSFVIGFSDRLPNCDSSCPADMSNSTCIVELTFQESKIAGCWGDREVQIAKLALTLSYLATTSLFGALVGFLVSSANTARGRNTREEGEVRENWQNEDPNDL